MLYGKSMCKDETDQAAGRLVTLAIIGAAHGLRGDVRVRSFTEDPAAFGNYGPLQGSDGKIYRVTSARPAGSTIIAHLAGIDDRTAAESLNGVELSVPRSVLASAGLEEGEFLHADLLGLLALDAEGKEYGRVIAIHDFGAGDVLEIQQPGARSHMVPFTTAAVPRIDVAAGQLILDPIAAGLAEADEG